MWLFDDWMYNVCVFVDEYVMVVGFWFVEFFLLIELLVFE